MEQIKIGNRREEKGDRSIGEQLVLSSRSDAPAVEPIPGLASARLLLTEQ